MSPHALPDGDVEEAYQGDAVPHQHTSNAANHDDVPDLISSKKSLLRRADDAEVHDLVCIGFGPASLAIAVALHDALEGRDDSLSTQSPKVRFLERQASFAWHAGMLLPGAKMQITFLKDMATLRNPRSEFTFINYLHQKRRLVSFTNLSTFLPQRIEYEDYMRWCADQFADVVDYGRDVQSVEVGSRDPKTGAIDTFQVKSNDRQHGYVSTIRARHVVIAAGGRPNIPKCLSASHPRVIHSSQYATDIHKIFPSGRSPKRVAVIGGGQSAAEVFHNIPSRFPGAQSLILIRGAALKPSDDSPFVNEVFNPERVDDIYSQDPQRRADAIMLDRATNYGVVRLELLEEIYSAMYSYRIKHGSSEERWSHRILNHRNVTGMTPCEVDGEPAVQLHVQNNSSDYYAQKQTRSETLTVDLVVFASGYVRNSHEDMLQGLREAAPVSDDHGKLWNVRRDYSVQFREGAVQSNAGVWLQGCNQETHGLADSLLSILAVRGGEVVQSILGRHHNADGTNGR